MAGDGLKRTGNYFDCPKCGACDAVLVILLEGDSSGTIVAEHTRPMKCEACRKEIEPDDYMATRGWFS